MTISSSLSRFVDNPGNLPGLLPPFLKGGWGGFNSAPRACREVWLRHSHKNIRCRQPKPTDQTPLPELVEGHIDKAGNPPGLPPPFQKGGWGDSTPLPELVEGYGFDTRIKTFGAGSLSQRTRLRSPSLSRGISIKPGIPPGFRPPSRRGGGGIQLRSPSLSRGMASTLA